ncbi:MAG: O-antigen ligase family protein [Proteobacteria bacterium]|nr:O-antigen ligase family protein [Pseudomonadota bacterium]
MIIRISTLLYITLCTMLVWPPYIGVRLGIIYLQPFKLLLIVFLFLSTLNYITRPNDLIARIRAVFSTKVGKSALLYLLFSFIATVVYGIDSVAIKFIANSVLLLLFCLLGGFFFAQTQSAKWPLTGLAVVGGVLGVIGVVEYFTGSNLFMQFAGSSKNESDAAFLAVAVSDKVRGAYRSQATFLHPLVFAQFLLISVPYIYVQCTKTIEMRLRIIWYFLLIAAISGIVFTGSRAAFGVLLLFILLFMVGATRSGSSSSSYAIRLLGPIIAGVVLILLVAILPGIVKAKLEGSSDLETSSTVARLIMLERTVDAMHERPLWGWGPGTAIIKAGIGNEAGGTIDCFHMTTGIERGLPALLLLILLQLTVVWCGFKRWLITFGPDRLLVGANTASLLGFFLVTVILSIDYLMPLAFFLIGIQASLVQGPVKTNNKHSLT